MLSENSFEKFIVYPNESIDKLTVNRSFERLYDEISSKNIKEFPITVSKATDSVYGIVKYSSSDVYYREEPDATDSPREYDDYHHAPMNLDAITDYSKGMSSKSELSSMYTSGNGSIESHTGWLKVDIGNFSTLDMPNGNKMVIGNFDISLSNLQVMFGTKSVSSESVVNSTELTGYGTVINMSDDDVIAINDFVLDDENDEQTRNDVAKLIGLDGKEMTCPYFNTVKATMKHNICNWTTYSSYKQSYVEVVFSMSMDLVTLYTQFNGYRKYTKYDGSTSTETEYMSSVDRPMEDIVFTAQPIVMTQLSFYNNETRPLPTFGYSKPDEFVQDNNFITTNTISDKELTTEDKNGYEVSVVNGNSTMKRFENLYRKNGEVYNNRVYFDVSMKFMVGGAYDPLMLDGLRNINAKAKLQFMMVGV